jgi:hypothetical protein
MNVLEIRIIQVGRNVIPLLLVQVKPWKRLLLIFDSPYNFVLLHNYIGLMQELLR